jgi:hypothetical protein
MEEIITLDGKQFKLTTDRPLTALERQQTMAQIRAQTGCSSCRQPKTLSTGGVYSLPFGNDGTGTNSIVGNKGSGSTINLSATPSGGVAPYDVRFWYSLDGTAITPVGTPHLTAPEDIAVTDSYVLLDSDIAGAQGGAGTAPTDVDTTTGVITLGGDAAALAAGSIRFYTSIVDSCAGAGGRGTCAQYVDVITTCVAPTCGFIVT